MRPLALRLQAFGSYGGVLEVDFARLGRHGVFSITGPTGAGKSTIFDAIVYALYDDLPGFRTDSHVRSQYADAATPTSVSLTFEADGTEWLVERSPTQPRPRKRGGGTPVVVDSRVTLTELGADGGGTTRKAAVADELVRLVGLTKAQFEQVVLIPQGRFEEVLKADTKDRAALLGRLFPVDVFRRTTDALRDTAAARRDEYERLSVSGAALVDQIRVDLHEAFGQAPDDVPVPAPDDPSLSPDGFDPEGIAGHRAALDGVVAAVTAARGSARARLDAVRARRAAAEAQAGAWDQWQVDQRAARGFPEEAARDAAALEDLDRARTVARMAPALRGWRLATDSLVRARAVEVELRAVLEGGWVDGYDRAALDGASGAAVLAARVAADAEELERADRTHDELVRRSAELDAAGLALARREQAVAGSATARTALDDRLVATRVERAVTAERAAGRADAEVRVRDLEQTLAAAGRRAAAQGEVERLAVAHTGALAAEDGAAERVIGLRTAWRAALAGRLAAHLEHGEPCPTCGSVDHPAPARPASDAPTDEELEGAEDELRARADAAHGLQAELAAARAVVDASGSVEGDDIADLRDQLDTARVERDAAVAAAADETRLQRSIDTLERERADHVEATTRESQALLVEQADLRARRLQWSRERDHFVATHGALVSTAPGARARRAMAGDVERLAATLATAEEARRAVDQGSGVLGPTLAEFGEHDPAALERWARPVDEIEREAADIADRAERRRQVEARLRSYVEDGGPVGRPDPTPLVEAEREAGARSEDMVGRHAVLTSRIAAVDSAVAELATRAGEITEARRRKEEAETLHAVCAGLGGGSVTHRLSLHNWVLAYYLRQVLAQANVRLDAMTDGRYALELDRESADGRKASGLDLSVLDAETGQSRPATTLSGGETFMAALALALGLADVVSAGSNYRIGALFVDEGFGSLDGESLDTVVDVLRSLQDGGRMVGVISHVQELKDALPHGITIEATSAGSRATLHYPDA